MKFINYSIVIGVLFSLLSCEKQEGFRLNTPKETILGQESSISLVELSSQSIDSVQLFVGKKQFPMSNNSATINSKEVGVGRHKVTALVFGHHKVEKITNQLKVLANKAPKAYKYKLLNTYPHDKKAYTQGLEFHNGILYETTGRVGKSWLRKVDYKTGEVLMQKDLSNYFGEGMTIIDNSIYWLTWLGGKGFIFNLDTFEETNKFHYKESQEGWGLTHNEQNELIKTDGSNKLYFLNDKGVEQYTLQATSNKGLIDKLNEVEYLNGKIYANRWITTKPIKSIIVVIDAKTGIIDGVVNLSALRDIIEKEQTLDVDEVLNGIAYNSQTNTFFVTGKHWGKLFEIEIFE